MFLCKSEPIEYVKFPDGTADTAVKGCNFGTIEWEYESMSELFVLLSLIVYNQVDRVFIKFLPMARQDNAAGFGGGYELLKILDGYGFSHGVEFFILDPHNPEFLNAYKTLNAYYSPVKDRLPRSFYLTTQVIYGDHSSFKKYSPYMMYTTWGPMYAEKERDLKTGKVKISRITNLKETNPSVDSILVIDDICDGGATFIELINAIDKTKFPNLKTIELFTTYGIYSKGKKILYDAGYTDITCIYQVPCDFIEEPQS